MLHEYRTEIHTLKQDNAHFANIFSQHNDLDQQIEHATQGDTPMTENNLENLKKEKLQLKDEALKMIMDFKKSQV